MRTSSTPIIKLPWQLILIVILVGFIAFFSGVLINSSLCQHCEKAVLTLHGYKVFGEHRFYCPLADR